jgi:hypothetical protein
MTQALYAHMNNKRKKSPLPADLTMSHILYKRTIFEIAHPGS